MNDLPQETLAAALNRASRELALHGAQPEVPAAAWAALDGRPRGAQTAAPAPRPARRWLPWAGGGLAFASMGFVALVLVALNVPERQPVIGPAQATAFLPLVGAQRWARLGDANGEPHPAWVVPAELPRESLAAMGLPYDPGRVGEVVRAELLVQASGDVIAIRFVH